MSSLVADLYQLTMADSYLRRGLSSSATFSLFVRTLPLERGFIVAAGVEDCLDALAAFRLEADDVRFVEGVLGRDVAGRLAGLSFTGAVAAVAEGTLVLAGEPLLEVTAPLPDAQLVETLLLNTVTFQSAVATKAARCVLAAPGLDLVDFSQRRTHGRDAALAVARVSLMAGFVATSNVEAGRAYGLPVSGTMAHSYVEAFPSEEDAFRAFAEDFPQRPTFLVDTYDTAAGVGAAIGVIRELRLQDRAAVRIDSGDLLQLSLATRSLLDNAGLPRVRIIVSGGLDEHALAALMHAGAPIDGAGVGTMLGVAADAPSLDSVYKLVAYDGRPVHKRSIGKATLPAAKQVFRGASIDTDVIALRDEPVPPAATPLLLERMRDGRRLIPRSTLEQSAATVRSGLAALPEHALELRCASPPVAAVSPRLRQLEGELLTRKR